ncbi:MAG TPA: TolC family protein [Flavipsychrobacter sp.]|nr:TolC family protein [Flavipsychrobacter sp.]
MRFLFTAAIVACFVLKTPVASAQDDVWSLQRCVQYAIDHNISIQQDILNKRLAKYTLLQSQLSQLPSVNATPAYGRSFGRSIDPTTNQFADNSYDFAGFSGTANLVVFGWFATRNTIAKNKYSLQASQADLDQLKDDVSLNVATGYLRALQSQEQINVSQKQVALSMAQLDQTKSFANSGRLPELNVAQLESQVASDSANLITAIANYTAAILDLKTLLNLDFDAPFTILAPDVKVADQISVSNMKPEDIFAEAKKHFGSIRSSELKVTAAEKGVSAAKGALYPQLNFTAQYGTNWASTYEQVTEGTSIVYNPIVFFTNLGPNAQADTIYQPAHQPVLTPVPFGKQLNNNFRQTYQVSLNIPIFNGWQSQYAVRQAKYNLATQQLNEYQAELTLKQDVYKAYNDAINSIQKYYAAVRASDAAQRALDFAKKRYDLGLTNTVDYLVTQNTQYSAESNMLSAKYDLIFKLKVIDYYLGKELKL